MKNTGITIFKYILLFIFTATALDKIYNFDSFTMKLYSSPLLDEVIVKPIAFLTIILEGLVCFLLLNSKWEKFGFLLASATFCFFTLYISCLFWIFKDTRPCACGFLFEWMTYPVHIAVNSMFFLLSFYAYTTYSGKNISGRLVATL